VRWTWDRDKAMANQRKHQVSFGLAEMALADPYAASQPDPHPDGDRWQTLGAVRGVLLFVVHTWPEERDGEEVGRIISARRATAWERRAYEERG